MRFVYGSACTAVVILVLVLLLAVIVCRCMMREPILGGAARRFSRPPESIVVDTLNLTHWLGAKNVDTCAIVAAIDKTAPALRKKYPGRVMYVVKDRESVLNDANTRIQFADAAKRNSVYIYAVERYEDETASAKNAPHSAGARDDLYMALLARRYKCPILTEDRFRDFDKFRSDVRPFHVYEFAYWRSLPERDYVRPSALTGLKKQPAVRYSSVF